MGTIERISGPLVVADDMLGSNMYDVVRVGKLNLIGEIIQLKKEKAVIQVYEDTTGLQPGEPVESTQRPLSVRLGPGLLSRIYDGIQRPLETLEKKSGAFIGRGIIAEPLDNKKKWKFIPGTIKKGAEVHEGDIIGHVQETELIKHYIMIPSGVKGKLKKLTAGSFTIDETVAEVEDGNKVVKVSMAQDRSVRRASRVKRKFRANEPLLSGMRVIDTLFPVAKGGTAAIPGPFGSGKCVSSDTPVILSDGEIKTMEELYQWSLNNGTVMDGEYERIVTTNSNIGLLSFADQKIRRSSSNVFYKGKSNSLVKVKTRTGKEVRVTPIHKLFKITETGEIVETMAKDLKAGDFIASARRIKVDNEDASIDPSMLRKLQRHGNNIRLPEKVSEEFAEFIGYFVSEGYIRGAGTVVFTNSEEELLDRFMQLSSTLFGLKGYKEYQVGKTPNVLLHSRLLVEFMKDIGVGHDARSKGIPSLLIKSSNKSLGAFLTAYFIGDGYYGDAEVEMSTASKRLQLQLSYVISRFGILHSLKERTIDGEKYYRIFVRGKKNIGLLAETLRPIHKKIFDMNEYLASGKNTFNGIDIVPLSPEYIEELYRKYCSYKKLLDSGIEISNYTTNREKMGVDTFRKFVNAIEVRAGNQLQKFAIHELAAALDEIYCDEIASLEIEDGEFDVYDVSLPEFGSNFIGGYGGLVLHNTVTQQSLAKYADSDIVVYVGCGERGNEMTDVLTEFPELKDPKTGRPLMERTVLVANTSNMPVAAREASIYTGITIAEYFRDMGYSVALMADSTSRWAEAMREISARLEEMPGEEGYPAYLPKRLAEYYERSGKVENLNGTIGSVTIIGAVSPPGGDISEPVSQGTLRVVKAFWALDAGLASSRHFPSINWLNSYSLYVDALEYWYVENIGEEFVKNRKEAMRLLQREAELKDIVQLVGEDALPDSERILLETGRMLREDYLRQSAFDEIDAYSSLKKQDIMLSTMLYFANAANEAVKKGANVSSISKMKARSEISRMKGIKDDEIEAAAKKLRIGIDSEFERLTADLGSNEPAVAPPAKAAVDAKRKK